MSEQRFTQVSFRCPREDAEALQAKAEANDRTLSAELRRVIRQHVERIQGAQEAREIFKGGERGPAP